MGRPRKQDRPEREAGKPKRPQNPFFQFCQDQRRKVAAGGDSCPEVVKDTAFKANSVWAVSPVPGMANPYMRGGTY